MNSMERLYNYSHYKGWPKIRKHTNYFTVKKLLAGTDVDKEQSEAKEYEANCSTYSQGNTSNYLSITGKIFSRVDVTVR